MYWCGRSFYVHRVGLRLVDVCAYVGLMSGLCLDYGDDCLGQNVSCPTLFYAPCKIQILNLAHLLADMCSGFLLLCELISRKFVYVSLCRGSSWISFSACARIACLPKWKSSVLAITNVGDLNAGSTWSVKEPRNDIANSTQKASFAQQSLSWTVMPPIA